jgi:hypothetical protein
LFGLVDGHTPIFFLPAIVGLFADLDRFAGLGNCLTLTEQHFCFLWKCREWLCHSRLEQRS